jgi:hypothetical protein
MLSYYLSFNARLTTKQNRTKKSFPLTEFLAPGHRRTSKKELVKNMHLYISKQKEPELNIQ